MHKEINNIFPVTVYGQLEKFNDTISKARCRIFYKGANRNGTFIDDEFADKLLSTIPYAPVKGIFDTEENDFTDHGTTRTEGRIYGVVAANPNLTWEDHLDEDGVTRTYACVDVLIYSALYPESDKIIDSAQSMELYRPSIKGYWMEINGTSYYRFTEGAFLGLQILGEQVEPCFEGAAFFSLYQTLLDKVASLEEVSKTSEENGKGGNKMPFATFQLSFEDIQEQLWHALNPNCDEEHNWECNYGIVATYSDYVVAVSFSDNKFVRAYYTKNEDETVTINSMVDCYMIDVTESEKIALEALRALNGDTYAAIDQKFGDHDTLIEKIGEYDTKIAELNNTISTLTIERDQMSAQYTAENEKNTALAAQLGSVEESLQAMTVERDELVAYRKDVEDKAKTAVIATYVNSLDADTITRYTENRANYTAEELDIQLTYEQKKAHPELFNQSTPPQYVLKDEPTKGGLEAILSRYEKKH